MTRAKYSWQWICEDGSRLDLEDMSNDYLMDGLCDIYNIVAIRDGLPTMDLEPTQYAKLAYMAKAIRGLPVPTSLIDLFHELGSRVGSLTPYQLMIVRQAQQNLRQAELDQLNAEIDQHLAVELRRFSETQAPEKTGGI
jgi:hypothetical protein